MEPTARRFSAALLLAALVAAAAAPGTAAEQERDRARVPDRYKWSLADLYPGDEAWRAAKDKVVKDIATLSAFNGTLGQSPQRLAGALDAVNHVAKDFQRVALYANLISDQDTRV